MRRRNSSSCLLNSLAKALAVGVLTVSRASSSKARGCRPQQQGRNIRVYGRRDIVRQLVKASATAPGQSPCLAQSCAVLSSILLISYWSRRSRPGTCGTSCDDPLGIRDRRRMSGRFRGIGHFFHRGCSTVDYSLARRMYFSSMAASGRSNERPNQVTKRPPVDCADCSRAGYQMTNGTLPGVH